MTKLSPRKAESGPKAVPITERLAILMDVFSPWDGIALTYKHFAAEIGEPVTVAAMKKWASRKKFPADVARTIVAKAKERGLSGVTLEWVLWGEGPGPQRTRAKALPAEPAPQPAKAAPQDHRQLAVQIAEALKADLGHNEFGQWSSTEVQHTVLWSLKDLARRLWVLRFAMGETFKLTDEWAARVGLPVRPPEPPGGKADAVTEGMEEAQQV
jgi:hypothetical protein